MTHSALYRGEVMHARHDALARRAFRYNVYVAALDLDELPALDRELRLFSRTGRTPFGFRERDYGDGKSDDLRASLAAICAANGLPAPHTTRLVTNLRTFGYVFNPVSFFLNYDRTGVLDTAIAEVNNTYGGRFRYVLGPHQRVASPELDRSIGGPAKRGWPSPYNEERPERGSGLATFRHVRELFVSPFLHGDASYEFSFDAPLDGERLAIDMRVEHDAGRSFTARLTGTRAALSDRTLLAAAVRYPLMTAQVIGLIHWQAVVLRFLGVPYRRPGVDHRPLRVQPERR
jgi:DUF1365 family protein